VRGARFLGIAWERPSPFGNPVNEVLRAVGAEFRITGDFAGANPLGSGHIHETFVTEYRHGGALERTVLQRLNTRIFADPRALDVNLRRITAHLRAKLAERGCAEIERRCLRPLTTAGGEGIVVDADGAHWRAFPYIEGTRSRDRIESVSQAREAARAFAEFAADLSDLPDPRLAITLPDFHDAKNRLEQLEAAVRADPKQRVAGVAAELEAAARSWDRIERALAEVDADQLPRRVMHNDCKLNNLLLDATTGEGLCVIDLDTTMDGTVLCDFGELVRSGTCRAAEDERNLASIEFEADLFAAIAEGYWRGAAAFLTEPEGRALPIAGPVLTFENAVRFLTDHLEGDVYFRIHREGQNLDRARAQLRLLESMLAAYADLRRTVERVSVRTFP
jgi:Ser/Thr protein kinase RdoA (MazF antagonist)